MTQQGRNDVLRQDPVHRPPHGERRPGGPHLCGRPHPPPPHRRGRTGHGRHRFRAGVGDDPLRAQCASGHPGLLPGGPRPPARLLVAADQRRLHGRYRLVPGGPVGRRGLAAQLRPVRRRLRRPARLPRRTAARGAARAAASGGGPGHRVDRGGRAGAVRGPHHHQSLQLHRHRQQPLRGVGPAPGPGQLHPRRGGLRPPHRPGGVPGGRDSPHPGHAVEARLPDRGRRPRSGGDHPDLLPLGDRLRRHRRHPQPYAGAHQHPRPVADELPHGAGRRGQRAAALRPGRLRLSRP